MKKLLLSTLLLTIVFGSDTNLTKLKDVKITDGKKINNIVYNNDLDNLKKDKRYNICYTYIKKNSIDKYDLGYRYGVMYIQQKIKSLFKRYSKFFDILFPFEQMYIEDILEPPKITSLSSKKTYENGNIFRKQERKYVISKPARFITKKLTWKDYLFSGNLTYKNVDSNITIDIEFSGDKECDKILVERSKEEFLKGLRDGMKEKEELYISRLKQMYRDLESYYLYYTLYYQKVILPPRIAQFEQSVKKGSDNLVIGEQVYQIVERAQFNENSKMWGLYIILQENINLINDYK